jgi:2-dehydropantoate 2-reductase
VAEAVSTARAQDIAVREKAVSHVFDVAAATAANRSSMGQDIDNKRLTEIDAINGYVVREAKRAGVAAPVNQTLTALVKTLEYHYHQK